MNVYFCIMMTTRLMVVLGAFLLSCGSVVAQRRLVAVDADTSAPIVGASVLTNGGTFVTDSMGRFAVPDSCTMMFLRHINYENRVVKLSEVHDTVMLISSNLRLEELVVFGVGAGDEKIAALNRSLRMEKQTAQMMNANPNQGLNLLGLFKALVPRKWFRNTKAERRKKLEKTLEDY